MPLVACITRGFTRRDKMNQHQHQNAQLQRTQHLNHSSQALAQQLPRPQQQQQYSTMSYQMNQPILMATSQSQHQVHQQQLQTNGRLEFDQNIGYLPHQHPRDHLSRYQEEKQHHLYEQQHGQEVYEYASATNHHHHQLFLHNHQTSPHQQATTVYQIQDQQHQHHHLQQQQLRNNYDARLAAHYETQAEAAHLPNHQHHHHHHHHHSPQNQQQTQQIHYITAAAPDEQEGTYVSIATRQLPQHQTTATAANHHYHHTTNSVYEQQLSAPSNSQASISPVSNGTTTISPTGNQYLQYELVLGPPASSNNTGNIAQESVEATSRFHSNDGVGTLEQTFSYTENRANSLHHQPRQILLDSTTNRASDVTGASVVVVGSGGNVATQATQLQQLGVDAYENQIYNIQQLETQNDQILATTAAPPIAAVVSQHQRQAQTGATNAPPTSTAVAAAPTTNGLVVVSSAQSNHAANIRSNVYDELQSPPRPLPSSGSYIGNHVTPPADNNRTGSGGGRTSQDCLEISRSSPCGANMSQDWLDKICGHLIEHMNHFGICVIDNFLGSMKGELILKEVFDLYSSGQHTKGRLVSNKFSNNSTSNGNSAASAVSADTKTTSPSQRNATATQQRDSTGTIRSDRVIWIDGCEEGCAEINNLIQTLCSVITNSSRLSLYTNNGLDKIVINKRTKAHVACYPGNGTRYIKHVDNPNGDGRVITAIYYLNKNWNTERDGGLLRMFPAGMDEVANIEPLFDRVLFFWSDRRNPHEVLPAYRDRFAITVWYIGENRT